MNETTTSVLTADIGSMLCEHLGQAKRHATLVAPFITVAAFDRLLAHLASTVTFSVFTRWRADEVSRGVSDPRVLDSVQAHPGASLHLHDRLHAKLFVIDDDVAVVGSANLTERALGFRDPPNIEVMAEIRPVPTAVLLLVRMLERSSLPATPELRDRVLREADALVQPSAPRSPVQEHPSENPVFPQFRTPERLYDGYQSALIVGDLEARSALLDDLLALSLPAHLAEPTFRQSVAAKLLAHPEIAAFDAFVAQPRFFHEILTWLAGRQEFVTLGLAARKRYAQTLIRWLQYFLPDRYRLDEPHHYSERFARII